MTTDPRLSECVNHSVNTLVYNYLTSASAHAALPTRYACGKHQSCEVSEHRTSLGVPTYWPPTQGLANASIIVCITIRRVRRLLRPGARAPPVLRTWCTWEAFAGACESVCCAHATRCACGEHFVMSVNNFNFLSRYVPLLGQNSIYTDWSEH